MAFCDLVNEFLEKHAGQPIKKASVNRELAFMKAMFNMAVEWGLVKENPCQSGKLLRGEEKWLRILNTEEISALVSDAAGYLKVIIVAAIETGMRKSELLSLRGKNVDFANGFIRVEHSKNGDARNVPISLHLRQTLQPLKQGRRQEDFVFIRDGKRIICFKEAFKAACRRGNRRLQVPRPQAHGSEFVGGWRLLYNHAPAHSRPQNFADDSAVRAHDAGQARKDEGDRHGFLAKR